MMMLEGIIILSLVIISAFLLHIRAEKNNSLILENTLPIAKVENDCIISKAGDLTFVLSLQLPEIFTLSAEEYKNIHQVWLKAIKVLPVGTVVHKQDWFTSDYFQTGAEANDSFLSRRSKKFFSGRPFLNHNSYLYITLRCPIRKPSSSMFSNLISPPLVLTSVNNKVIKDFQDKVSQFQSLLAAFGFITPRRLSTEELTGSDQKAGLIERYCFLLRNNESSVIRDISFKPEWQIGEYFCNMYSLSDVTDLPHSCSPNRKHDKYSTDQSDFPIGFTTPLGNLLNCEHILNQVIVIEDVPKTLKKLESKRRRLQSLSAYSRENAFSMNATNEFLNEAVAFQRLPVKAHLNLMVWTTDRDQLSEIRNEVSAAIAKVDATPHQEVFSAPELYWACLPGNIAELKSIECFDTFAEQAICFLNQESPYRSAPGNKGVRFADRVSSRPVYVDLYDEPRAKGVTSNMGTLVCGSSH